MTKGHLKIDLLGKTRQALTLSGTMEGHSTRRLHAHSHHQALAIRNGVTLLVDDVRKQPLFGTMTAFIPANLPHRSIVTGRGATYKCLYLAPELFNPGDSSAAGISIFRMSPLGDALFQRINIRSPEDLARGLNRECLELLLKMLPEEMAEPANLVRLPEPKEPQNRKVIEFIEKNFARRLAMKDFTQVIPYSERHLGRLFKADLGITVFEYLRLYRALAASIQLSDSARSITQIAYDSGYESISTFYRDFQLFFAATPRAFRDGTTTAPRFSSRS